MLTDLFIIGNFKLLFVEQFVRRVFSNCLAENMPFPCTKGFCAATLHHGDIRDLVVHAFVQSIMNFVSPARNEAISPKILWYIPLYYQQQHAYQFLESAVGTGHRYHQLKYKVVYKNTLRG